MREKGKQRRGGEDLGHACYLSRMFGPSQSKREQRQAWSWFIRHHFTSSLGCFGSNSSQLNVLSRLSDICLKSLFHHLFSSHYLTHGSPGGHNWWCPPRDAKRQLFLSGPPAHSPPFPTSSTVIFHLYARVRVCVRPSVRSAFFEGSWLWTPRGQRSNK